MPKSLPYSKIHIFILPLHQHSLKFVYGKDSRVQSSKTQGPKRVKNVNNKEWLGSINGNSVIAIDRECHVVTHSRSNRFHYYISHRFMLHSLNYISHIYCHFINHFSHRYLQHSVNDRSHRYCVTPSKSNHLGVCNLERKCAICLISS